eukprot:6468499-Amphidinium_carterae.3
MGGGKALQQFGSSSMCLREAGSSSGKPDDVRAKAKSSQVTHHRGQCLSLDTDEDGTLFSQRCRLPQVLKLGVPAGEEGFRVQDARNPMAMASHHDARTGWKSLGAWWLRLGLLGRGVGWLSEQRDSRSGRVGNSHKAEVGIFLQGGGSCHAPTESGAECLLPSPACKRSKCMSSSQKHLSVGQVGDIPAKYPMWRVQQRMT